ncbi:MAG: ComF family protein [Proteobacteria bacterium]|nr:ComF family protein [Pseudomonadota bacterium]MBU1059740.1 ComF family protein [Pseudomonadota bacterium]
MEKDLVPAAYLDRMLSELIFLRKWLRGAVDLLFPAACPVCGTNLPPGGQILCSPCLQDVALIRSPLCSVCGRELPDSTAGDHCCGRCLRKSPPYISARGVGHYQSPLSGLLHRLKYQGETSVLPALRDVIDLLPPFVLQEEERIVPVPLYASRLRQRGFNQALVLAKLFFPTRKDHILVDTLVRVRHTIPQTGLDGIARRKNLHQAFSVRFPERVRRRTIVLVDDVFTTGTTVSECSRMLLRAGADEVRVLTLARVRE